MTCSMRFTPLSIHLIDEFGVFQAVSVQRTTRDIFRKGHGLTQHSCGPYHCLFDQDD
jgi:hypothetical protein